MVHAVDEYMTDLRERLRVIHEQATPGPWEHGVVRDKTTAEHVDHLRESLEKGGQTGAYNLHGIYLQGDEKIIATSGNGPTSATNADAIATLRTLLPDILTALEELEKYQHGGVTEELLRKQGGYIRLDNQCSIVLTHSDYPTISQMQVRLTTLEQALDDRDRLWCAAIIQVQRPVGKRLVCDSEELLHEFNRSKAGLT
jgi:hypothetical protein